MQISLFTLNRPTMKRIGYFGSWARLVLALLIFSGCSQHNLGGRETGLWELTEWSVDHPDFEGNPFDLPASVAFTHEDGRTITTGMFYDGDNRWKFRFTATLEGEWDLSAHPQIPDLDGYSGKVYVGGPGDPGANGFITNLGGKWGWQGSERAFVPQFVMGKDLDYYYDTVAGNVLTDLIEKDIEEFIDGHGFTGFHIPVNKQWYDITGQGPFVDPDIRTYRVLETILAGVHAKGGACHLWMWGSDGPRDMMTGSGPRGVLGAAGNEKDLRNLRYLAARLGPCRLDPGIRGGYGKRNRHQRAARQLESNPGRTDGMGPFYRCQGGL